MTVRKLLRTVLVALTAVAVLLVARWLVKPSLHAGQIRLAAVDRGPVEAATLCSGTVVPATEQVIVCPFDSRVRRVLERPGARLEPGQPIVELDDDAVKAEVGRLENAVSLTLNRHQEQRLELDGTLADLASQHQILIERLAFLKTRAEQQRALAAEGLSSSYELRQAELNERIANIELQQLDERTSRTRETGKAKLRGLVIEADQQSSRLHELRQRLERAVVRSTTGGVLTWVADEEGATVREGAVVARIADLSRLRVEATTSDLHAAHLVAGMPVRVKAGDVQLPGRVSNVPPAIEKGVMNLEVDASAEQVAAVADPIQIEQVVVNLVRNAIEAVPDGGWIRLRPSVAGGRPTFTVEDSGPGMSPEALENLFTPFFTTKKDVQGVGLTLAREILAQHGGDLVFEVSPGAPTRVQVRLPAIDS